jgi:hypothetical protein
MKYVVYCYNNAFCGKKDDDGNFIEPYHKTYEIEARAGNEVTATGDLIIYTKNDEDETILHTMFASGEWVKVEFIDEAVKPSPEAVKHVAGTVLDAIRRNAPGNLDGYTRTEGGAGA